MRWPDRQDQDIPLQTAFHLAHEVQRLSRASLPSDTAELARYLIGKTIVRKAERNRISGRIVETEAYPPGDPSGHAYHGERPETNRYFWTVVCLSVGPRTGRGDGRGESTLLRCLAATGYLENL